MALNVLGIRRLGQVIGLCEANVPCPKCGEAKPCRGQSPNTVLRNPSRRTGGGAYTVCYAMGRRTPFFYTYLPNNSLNLSCVLEYPFSFLGKSLSKFSNSSLL